MMSPLTLRSPTFSRHSLPRQRGSYARLSDELPRPSGGVSVPGRFRTFSAQAAPLFPQPVALTRRLSDALVGEDDCLELLRTAHKGLVAVAGKEPVKTAHTFDFRMFGLELRFLLTFARSQEADARRSGRDDGV